MSTLRKKGGLLLITVIFSFGVIGFLGVGVTHASIFDFIRAFVTINPLAVKVTVPSETDINRVFQVEANVINKGEVKIENVTGEIFLPAGLSLVGKNQVKNIGIIPKERLKHEKSADQSGLLFFRNFLYTVLAIVRFSSFRF